MATVIIFPYFQTLIILTQLYQGWTQRGRLRGALQAEDLFRAVQAVSGVRKPLLIGEGSGGAPPGNFIKSMTLRMHFRPF